MPIATTIGASYPAILPYTIKRLQLSGTQLAWEISIPKNVWKTKPITRVAIPRVATSGANLAAPATFLSSKPMIISKIPYPASPIHIAKKRRKNTDI